MNILLALLPALLWFVISVIGGRFLYVSTLTVSGKVKRKKEPQKKDKAKSAGERFSAVIAHTKDPRIMEPLTAAKERWLLALESGHIEEIHMVSKDGLDLAGYYQLVDHGSAGKTALLVHGLGDSAAGLGYLAEEYLRAGWNVLAIDVRAHGKSGGFKRTMGVREADDIGLWVDFLLSKKGATSVCLHGISMGAAAVLLYAGRKVGVPAGISGVVADSSFDSYKSVFIRLLKREVHSFFIAWSLFFGMSLASFFFSGVRLGRVSPVHAARCISVPVLLFHGKRDILITEEMAEKLFSACMKPDTESVVIPEAPHIGAYFYAPEQYMDKIFELNRRKK